MTRNRFFNKESYFYKCDNLTKSRLFNKKSCFNKCDNLIKSRFFSKKNYFYKCDNLIKNRRYSENNNLRRLIKESFFVTFLIIITDFFTDMLGVFIRLNVLTLQSLLTRKLLIFLNHSYIHITHIHLFHI